MGHYLKGMHPASSPALFHSVLEDMIMKGAKGFLISGGCSPDGSIPLEPFVPEIQRIKEKYGAIVNMHVGIGSIRNVQTAARCADIVSVEMVTDDRVLREVYGLAISSQKLLQFIEEINRSTVPFIAPHITLGLYFGEMRGEYEALEHVASLRCEKLIVNVLTPTKGTPMENISPPSIKEIEEFIAHAKNSLSVPLVLGCMRPRGPALEEAAVRGGAEGIVVPSPSTVRKYPGRKIEACCAVPTTLEERFY